MRTRASAFGIAVIVAFAAFSGQGASDPPRIRRHLSVAGCSYAISPAGRSHGAAFGSGMVTVTAPSGCAWTAASNDPWITITDGSSGTGGGTVTYGVASNTAPPRSGTITVAGRAFTVSQAAEEITVYLGRNNTVPLVLVRVPAGTFTMGAPPTERGYELEIEHQVTLTRDYYIGKTEITQLQWVTVMGSNPNVNDPYGTGDDYPVSRLGWFWVCGGATGDTCSAISFVGKLNQLLGTTKFRLPTEAEWERAARGGTQTPFSFGDDESCSMSDCSPCALFDKYMWWCGNSGGTSHPVAQKLPNPYGLFDMHGNAWELVADWFDLYPSEAQVDPTGPAETPGHACRSGGWRYEWAQKCRSAGRSPLTVNESDLPEVGFRIARSL